MYFTEEKTAATGTLQNKTLPQPTRNKNNAAIACGTTTKRAPLAPDSAAWEQVLIAAVATAEQQMGSSTPLGWPRVLAWD